jgi:hypothetical protein
MAEFGMHFAKSITIKAVPKRVFAKQKTALLNLTLAQTRIRLAKVASGVLNVCLYSGRLIRLPSCFV